MRDITNDFGSIYAAQTYLNTLHFKLDRELPLVWPDGIFGSETTAAVKSFQRLYGLPITGEIDLATWNALYESYLLARRQGEPIPLDVFPRRIGYVIELGERSEVVAVLQLVLKRLSNIYETIVGEDVSGFYGEATRRDVSEFQRINQLPETGAVDQITWDALAESYNRESMRE